LLTSGEEVGLSRADPARLGVDEEVRAAKLYECVSDTEKGSSEGKITYRAIWESKRAVGETSDCHDKVKRARQTSGRSEKGD
jgi:hypothetical protein